MYIAAAVRCAPPANKPLPVEIASCADHLAAEVAALPNLRVVVALGKIAWDAWLAHLSRQGLTIRPRPTFAHGAVFQARAGAVATAAATVRTLIGAYHPSRQNTNTGTVTAAMYNEVFERVKALASDPR